MLTPVKDNIIKLYGKDPETLYELAECAIRVVDFNKSKIEGATLQGFSWNITYGDCISNSHSAPEGYPRNFGNKPNLPRGYPGWQGRLWVRYDKEVSTSMSDLFSSALIHTGSGGYGAYGGPWTAISLVPAPFRSGRPLAVYSWDLRIFADDWLAIKKNLDKQLTWSILSNQDPLTRHVFSWTDPVVQDEDTEFIRNKVYSMQT